MEGVLRVWNAGAKVTNAQTSVALYLPTQERNSLKVTGREENTTHVGEISQFVERRPILFSCQPAERKRILSSCQGHKMQAQPRTWYFTSQFLNSIDRRGVSYQPLTSWPLCLCFRADETP